MSEHYFYWLIGLIGDEYIGQNYQKLLWKLYARDYIWSLDLDENRAADGLYLRVLFAQSLGMNGRDPEILKIIGVDPIRPCSILEMFIALSRRAENDLMHDPDYGDRTGKWFWEIVENLGLDTYDDYHWFEDEVEKILNNFLFHKYKKSGMGGAFPLHNQMRDMRQTDLWWQMNAYMEERMSV